MSYKPSFHNVILFHKVIVARGKHGCQLNAQRERPIALVIIRIFYFEVFPRSVGKYFAVITNVVRILPTAVA
jgi:hypothetical protein